MYRLAFYLPFLLLFFFIHILMFFCIYTTASTLVLEALSVNAQAGINRGDIFEVPA